MKTSANSGSSPPDFTALEAQRLSLQARLDLAKTARERNPLGQFATPPGLAQEIVAHALRLRGPGAPPPRFLEPAVGTGAFYSALRQKTRVARALAFEIDPQVAATTSALYGSSGLTLRLEDFTRALPQGPRGDAERFDLVIANPPYVRHHHMQSADKARLKEAVQAECGLTLSGLAGLYCAFLLLSDRWLAPGGLCLWLIPSEFMDVNYGAALREYLSTQVTLLQIHRFAPEDVQFTDALVTSTVVIFKKAPPDTTHQVRFSLGGPLATPGSETTHNLAALRASSKWSQLATQRSADPGRLTLGDLFSIRRGVATGANEFFVLPRREALALGIPARFLRPLLPSPRRVLSDVVEAAEDGYPLCPEPLALLACREPEAALRKQHPALAAYLERGRAQGIHQGYLTSHRQPWYAQEEREPAPFLCSYMGRGSQERSPFRMVWNRSLAIGANVWLLLYPREPLRSWLLERPGDGGLVFAALKLLQRAALQREGRVYGGGLHKLEPRELERVDATLLLEALPDLRPRKEQEPGLFERFGIAV